MVNSCSQALFAFIESIEHFTSNPTNVYTVLDASKAFNKVLHNGPFVTDELAVICTAQRDDETKSVTVSLFFVVFDNRSTFTSPVCYAYR